MSEERNEKNITEGDEEVGNKENFDWNKEDYNQGNACVNDDIVHGHGVRRKHLNILGRCRSKWRGVECDLVEDVGVFLAKGRVVACNPHEIILDDWLGEDHVGLCILYCHATMLVVMEMHVASNNYWWVPPHRAFNFI
jgi:hypothetical protein